MSEDRVKRLQSLDKCRCHRKRCFQKVQSVFKQLMQFLELFWSMAKNAQDLFAHASFVLCDGAHSASALAKQTQPPVCCTSGVGGDRRLQQGATDLEIDGATYVAKVRGGCTWNWGLQSGTFEVWAEGSALSYLGRGLWMQ